ncbi:hypothetical protein GCM10010400_02170 [Streptomyces aculeolatus]
MTESKIPGCVDPVQSYPQTVPSGRTISPDPRTPGPPDPRTPDPGYARGAADVARLTSSAGTM